MRPFRLTPLAVAVAASFVASEAFALPTGADIRGGQGAVSSPNAGSVVVRQDSARLAIDWQSFGIAAGESVRFLQPGASSIALNRVLGNSRSEIFGNLSANGQVFLLNANGVLFGRSAQVDVGGLVASTLDISPADFMAGKTTFSGGNGGGVVNQGRLSAASGGYVALLGPVVRNEGVIEARMGTVALAAGDQVTLNFGGNSLVGLSVDRGVVGALAENRQLIQADGGRVLLSARAADDVVRAVVNNTGVIEANTVSNVNGLIRLEGLGASTVTSSGTLTARGDEAGATGGTVQMLGERVGLLSGGQIDASGSAGGGTVLVGGDWQGKNPDIQNAFRTYVAPDASIKADAILNGDGGKVVVWSDDATRYFGAISAKGGANGGNGGAIEISGKGFLDFSGTVDTSAALGRYGTLLLDPTNIEVVTTGGTATLVQVDQFADVDLTTCASLGGAVCSKIAPATINAAGANVTLQATDSILFTDPVSIATAGVGLTATTQTGGIAVNANITTANASVADAVGNQTPTSGSITLSAGTSVTGTGRLTTGNAQLTGIDAAGTDSATSGSISITAGTGGVSGAIGLSNTTALVIGTATRVGASTDTATAGNITLTSRDGIDNGTALTPLQVSFGAATGAAALNQGSLSINTTTAVSNAHVTSTGSLLLNASSLGGNLNVASAGVSQVSGTALVVGGTTDINAGTGSIDLPSTTNDFTGTVTLVTTGGVNIADANILKLAPVSTSFGINVTADDLRLSNGTYATGNGNFFLFNSINPGTSKMTVGAAASDIVTIDTSALSGNMFLNGLIEGPGSLVLTTGTGGGVVAFNNDIGQATPLKNLTITSGNDVGLPGMTLSGNLDVTGQYIFQISNPINVAGTTRLENHGGFNINLGSIFNDFGDTVTVITDGNLNIADANILKLAPVSTSFGISVTADDLRLSNGTYATGNGNFFLFNSINPGTSKMTVGAAASDIVTIDTSSLSGNMFLNGLIEGPGSLVLTTGTGGGVVAFNNDIGQATPLKNLTITSGNDVGLPGMTLSGNLDVTGQYIFQISNPINVAGTTRLENHGGFNINLGSIFNDFGDTVTVITDGNLNIADANILKLAPVSTSFGISVTADDLRLSNGTYATGNGNFFLFNSINPGTSKMTVGAAASDIVTIDTSSLSGNMFLNGLIEGPGSLVLTTGTGGGVVAFNNDIGQATPLKNLTITSGNDVGLPGMTLSGNLDVTGQYIFQISNPINVAGTTRLENHGGFNINLGSIFNDFGDTVTVITDGNLNIADANILKLAPVSTSFGISVTADDLRLSNGTYATGNGNFFLFNSINPGTSKMTVGAAASDIVTIDTSSLSGNMFLNGLIQGPGSLVLTTGTGGGVVAFNNDIGQATPLKNLTITSGNSIAFPDVKH